MKRNFQSATEQKYDVIIVGGGMYGIMLAWTASQMGLSNLLIEKNDFGGATSFNHLRTIHGGLRYLQTFDLPRFFESVRERQWFLKTFPEFTTVLPCLMPLYGNGPYKPSIFRAALKCNDLLSWSRNKGVLPTQKLPDGYTVSSEEVIKRFPFVDRENLKGGAVWYDGGMPSPQLITMAILTQASQQKTTALNYAEGKELIVENNTVQGLKVTDNETGCSYNFKSSIVINATGPWCRKFAASFDKDDPQLFQYSIAWNVLFNRKALSNHSVAVKPKRPASRMYFIHGFDGRIMAGTVHSPWGDNCENPLPAKHEIGSLIDDINLCIPNVHLEQSDVLQVFAGLLPAKSEQTTQLATREVIKDHGEEGGPKGAFSVSGVKFTTARLVAEKMLRKIFPKQQQILSMPKTPPIISECIFPFNWSPQVEEQKWKFTLEKIIRELEVVHLDDLLLRRTTIGENCQKSLAIAPEISELFGWDETKKQDEIRRVKEYYQQRGIK